MKIVEDFDREGVVLSSISPGELFTYDGSYYMKGADNDSLTNVGEHRCVAMDMATGEIWSIDKNIKVPPIYARIRINGRAD